MLVRDLSNEEQLLVIERVVIAIKKDMGEYKSVQDAIENTFDLDLEEIMDDIQVRVCDECSKIMTAGYCIGGGDEYYCSDDCLRKNYTDEEYKALCAELDPNNEDDLEKLRNMTDEEFHDMAGGSDTYYTEWEI